MCASTTTYPYSFLGTYFSTIFVLVVDHAHLFDELIRFEIELWNAVDQRLRASHELPLSWFVPMQVMNRRVSCRVNDIADELSMTVGGTSKLVDRIEKAGYCRRLPNPVDRRSSLIKLSPRGVDLLAEATVSFEAELELRFGMLSSAALAQLGATLDRLRAVGHELDGR